jgi:carboxymethylenebutenolidase
MGGALTIAAAVHVKGLDTAVCFYGIPLQQLADPNKIQVPIQFHFANIDEWCTPAAVDSLEASLKDTSIKFELYRYEAQHAFFNETRPEVFDPKASALAWERSLEFLKRYLG